MGGDQEEPHISSTLQWQDVVLPPSIAEADLDQIILSIAQQDWRKTAYFIGTAVSTFKERGIQIDAEIIGARIRELARRKRIDCQGDLSMWRHSEVRLLASC